MKLFNTLFFSIICFCSAFSQLEIELEEFADGFDLPLGIAHHGTETLYVMGKRGDIWILNPDGSVASEKFLDISDRVDSGGGELGLLGLAFHPDYENNGEFFVNYTNAQGLTVVSRFFRDTLNPMKGDKNVEDKLMQFAQPFNNHNGGDIKFGPDGYLYIASGDGGSSNDPQNNSQNIQSYLGKMLRIDVDSVGGYKVPPSNPFVGVTGIDEIWAFGLRNPWRFSFDKMTGDMWIGDVGQNALEEIDFQPANSPGGENYGWKCYEGNNSYITRDCDLNQTFTFPIYEYNNDKTNEGCSITGGYVYRGSQYSALVGHYVYADYCSGLIWALSPSDTVNVEIEKFNANEIASFGEDKDGELYVVAIRQGKIYKITKECNLTIETQGSKEECPGANDGTGSVMISDTNFTGTITWSNGDTTTTIDSLAPGTYTVIVEDDGCLVEDSIVVESSDLMMSCLADTSIAGKYCMGDTVSILACLAASGYEYEWSMGDAVIPGESDQILKVTETGTYSVSMKGPCALGASEEVTITFVIVPEMGVITQSQDTLKVDANADTYNWYKDGMFWKTTSEPFVKVEESGIYTVEGVNDDLCTGLLSAEYNYMTTSAQDVYLTWVNLYPNPLIDQLTIENTSDEVLDISIQDAQGREYWMGELESKLMIPFDNVKSGTYFVSISGKWGTAVRQIVVRK